MIFPNLPMGADVFVDANTKFVMHRIPLWVKLGYSAFVCVLVPYYWTTYGPTNFLYFCDVALLLGLGAVWLESPLLASMPAVGILLPQMFWVVDFITGLFGHSLTGMTAYMFDSHKSLFVRGLSFFHGWLPFFLLWLVWRLGYDRRAFVAWTLLAWALLLVCYFFLPAGPPPTENPNLPVNVNYVFGLSDEKPQDWMPAWAWLTTMLVGLPLIFFLPTHLLLSWLFRPQHNAQV